MIGVSVAQVLLVESQRSGGGNAEFARLMGLISMVRGVAAAGGVGFLVAAVFVGRRPNA